LRKVLLPVLGLLLLALAFGGNASAQLLDPADLHVGPGAGTLCATGCGADPNTISATGFDIYYNPNTNSSQLPIGDPFYLLIATPVYTGSTNSPTVGGTATMYATYPGGTQTTVSVGGAVSKGEMTSGDLYAFIGLGPFANNSFQFGNMVACDIGTTSGQNACPNASLGGSKAPLFGDNITGYDVFTFSIGTNTFAPNDLLDFTGNLPIGSYVAAIGVDYTALGGKGEAWAVPFTESGIVTSTNVPEPSSFMLLGAGLLALAAFSGRRLLTA
jgi:PEP-CTERM motif-containing protein